ncbi:phosphatase PAP2 family protein [Candidatus Micrarchaeota archaeon]|nr:phosphatase PAP2 family protein [Candidatus Micrarchaeota archaeon]
MMFDAVTLYISQLNFPVFTWIASLFDNDFIFLAIILLLAFVAESGKKRNMLILTIGLVFLLGSGVKYLSHEARPCLVLPSKVECPSSYSFPSNHSVVAFALAMALWRKPKGWLYVLFAFFIAFTRIYLGVHTVLDVLGGAIIGILGCLLIDVLWKYLPLTLKTPLSNFLE